MSGSHDPADSHALVQSMLQRLKLQSGRERQACLHTDGPTSASMGGKNGVSGDFESQKLNNITTNVFEFGANTKRFGFVAEDNSFSLGDGESLQLHHKCDEDIGHIPSPFQKDSVNSDARRSEDLRKASLSEKTFLGTTSLSRTDNDSHEEKGGFGNKARIKDNFLTGGNKQEFVPKVNEWSLRTSDCSSESQGSKQFHAGNGGFGSSAQIKDKQIVLSGHKTDNGTFRRKKRSSENKAMRWTQKIKARWMDKPGSLAKKGKAEECRLERRDEQEYKLLPRNQLLASENLKTSNKDGEGTLPPLNCGNISDYPARAEQGVNDADIRSSGSFDFGLGSFSLLEEIVTGQEWGQFLYPTSGNQRLSGKSNEPQITPDPPDRDPFCIILNQSGGTDNLKGIQSLSHVGGKQTSADDCFADDMDVGEGNEASEKDAQKEADPLELMVDGYTESGLEQGSRTPPYVESADILENPARRYRAPLNRKRQHRLASANAGRLRTDHPNADKGEFIPSVSNHLTDETLETNRDNVMSSSPLSPSSPSPCAPALKGVLKHSISLDSESSMETETKRRRVEMTRRVHFSEEVVAIEPVELDTDSAESEENSIAEEDSFSEQFYEMQREAEPARRPSLPAWILALKRRNTGRKYR